MSLSQFRRVQFSKTTTKLNGILDHSYNACPTAAAALSKFSIETGPSYNLWPTPSVVLPEVGIHIASPTPSVSQSEVRICTVGYNEFDFFLENEEYRPFDGCKIEI